jgi:hypothetical protein
MHVFGVVGEREFDPFATFPGKVDAGFPKGNATSIDSGALSGHGRPT